MTRRTRALVALLLLAIATSGCMAPRRLSPVSTPIAGEPLYSAGCELYEVPIGIVAVPLSLLYTLLKIASLPFVPIPTEGLYGHWYGTVSLLDPFANELPWFDADDTPALTRLAMDGERDAIAPLARFRATDELEQVARDSAEPEVRTAALDALVDLLPIERLGPILLERFTDDPDADARLHALLCLADHGVELRDSNPDLAARATARVREARERTPPFSRAPYDRTLRQLEGP